MQMLHVVEYFAKSLKVNKMVPFERLDMALSCIISEIKRDIGQKLIFHTPCNSFDAPIMGVPVTILPYRLVRKNQNLMVWLPDHEIV